MQASESEIRKSVRVGREMTIDYHRVRERERERIIQSDEAKTMQGVWHFVDRADIFVQKENEISEGHECFTRTNFHTVIFGESFLVKRTEFAFSEL